MDTLPGGARFPAEILAISSEKNIIPAMEVCNVDVKGDDVPFTAAGQDTSPPKKVAIRERTQGASRYSWELAWDDRIPQIDERILRFVRDTGDINADNVIRLSDNIRIWIDQQVPRLSHDAQWQFAKSDSGLLQEMLDQRFGCLLRHGQLHLTILEVPVIEE